MQRSGVPKMNVKSTSKNLRFKKSTNTLTTEASVKGQSSGFFFAKSKRTGSFVSSSNKSEAEPGSMLSRNMTVQRRREEGVHNCHFFLEDQRMYTMFLKKDEFEFKSEVSLKLGTFPSRGKTMFLNLRRGKLFFDVPNAILHDQVYEIAVHDIIDLRYSGQTQPSFSFDAFIENPADSKRNKSQVLGTNKDTSFTKHTYTITCTDNIVAKQWVMYLMLTCENYGDVIVAGISHLRENKMVERSFEHIECMLRKRVLMYRLSLPRHNVKLLDSLKDLAEHLLFIRKPGESFALNQEIEEEEELIHQDIASIITRTDSYSALESLKMETKYFEALFNT